MKNAILICLIASAMLSGSCRKNFDVLSAPPVDTPISPILNTYNLHIYDYVDVFYNRFLTPVDSGYQILAEVQIFDAYTGPLNFAPNVLVNGNPLNGGDSYLIDYSPNPQLPSGKDLSGSTSTVSITGASAEDTLNGTIYVASDIGNSLKGIPTNGTADFSQPMALSWAPDAQSSQLKVLIQLSYDSSMSKRLNAGMPDTMKTLTYVTTDNGSFTIPAADINTIPVGSYWLFLIERYYEGQGTLAVSKRQFYLLGESRATLSSFKVVVQ